MFGSTVLEVAVGVTFVFFILSLLVSSAREVLEGFLQSRAVHLERGIRELLNDRTGENLARQIYQHPLINSLYTGVYDPATQLRQAAPGKDAAWPRLKYRTKLPAYIPARNFALALLDLSARGEAVSAAGDAQPVSYQRVRDGVTKNIPNAQVQRAVVMALDQAKGDLEQARANLEAWFDSGMDRVSGWYRKQTQWILLSMGLIAAVGLNVDTIRITHTLYQDDAMRTLLVAEAEGAVEASGDEGANAQRMLQSLGCDPAAQARKNVSCTQERLQALGLPIGWEGYQFPWQRKDAELGSAIGLSVLTVLGWMITALAVTLGAPFWFDLLNKIMIIRSTVKPHEKSPEESSEDRQTRTDPPRDPTQQTKPSPATSGKT